MKLAGKMKAFYIQRKIKGGIADADAEKREKMACRTGSLFIHHGVQRK